MKKVHLIYMLAGLFSWFWLALIILSIYTLISAFFGEGQWLNVLLSILGTIITYKTTKFLQKIATELKENYTLKIIHAYGNFIGETFIPLGVISDESMLPYSKYEIKQAIKDMLKITKDTNLLNVLKNGYIDLAYFQPDIGNEPIGIIIPTIDDIDKVIKQISNQKDIPAELQERVEQELREIKKEISIYN